MKEQFRSLFLLATILILQPRVASSDPKSFTIGIAAGLTGDAAVFGTQELNAAKLAIEEVNERKRVHLNIKVEDTVSTGLGTVNAVKRLLDIEKLKIIIGPTWLDTFQGVLPIVGKYGALIMTPSAYPPIFKKTPQDYPLVFSTYFNFQIEITKLLEVSAQRGLKRLALLYDNEDPYFVEMRQIVIDHARESGLEIVFEAAFGHNNDNFRSLINRALVKKIDAFIFGSAHLPAAVSFLKQRKVLAPSVHILGSHDLEGYETMPIFQGLLTRTVYIAPAQASQDFEGRFKAKYSSEPIMTASNAYDAVKILATALESGAETPEEISAFLRENSFDTASFGKMRFSPLGSVESGMFVIGGSL